MALAANTPNAAQDRVANALRQAGEGIDHMHATLEQLLQLARVETATAGDTRHTVGTEIAQAFRLACRQSLHRAKNEGSAVPAITLDAREVPSEPAAWETVQLPLAPALLTCAITNLVDNALRYHRGPTSVSATLQWHAGPAGDGQVEICVRDQGPGLTADECGQALKRFWRKSGSDPGSGLGLTIVHRIAESAGGTLVLEPGTPGLVARLRLSTCAADAAPAHGIAPG